MAPLISYFRNARESLGVSAKQIADATGKKNMVSHWFGISQWQLPNEADYLKLQALFQKSPWISTHATNWESLTTSLSPPGNR